MILQGSSVRCSHLCKGHLQVHAAWGNHIIFSPAYLSKCFMVYSCGEKHFGVGRDLFPFLMFLLGWINTFSRNETSGHVGNMETRAPLCKSSSFVTDTCLQQRVPLLALNGSVVRSRLRVPQHPPHKPLCHNPTWNRLPLCRIPLTPAEKRCILRALESLEGWECIIDTIFLALLHPACAHLNIFGKWVLIKWVFLSNSNEPLIFMRFVKCQQNDFLKRKKKLFPRACSFRWFWLRLLIELLVCYEKDYSYSDLELDEIRKYHKSLHMTFLQTLPALE